MFAVKTFEERDEFGRKNIAEKVIKLLDSDINVSPLVINGAWGIGKSEFCHKLISMMRKHNTHHVIYVDAFQADHVNSPLLTMLAEVIKVLPNETTKKQFIRKAIPYVRYGLKTVGKAGLAHFLRQDANNLVEEFNKEIQDTADKIIDISVETILKDHVDSSKNLKALQNALETIANVKPIVLFIDELDRCRPDFAVHVLEIIKHTFDVTGVQFVLITNTHQLKAAISHCYGQTVDAQRYLDKFFKFTFDLPSITGREKYKELASVHHFKNLVATNNTLKDTKINEGKVLDFIERVIYVHSLSLREIETLVRNLEIYELLTRGCKLTAQLGLATKLLIVFAVILYCFDRILASSITHHKTDAEKFAEFFEQNRIVDIYEGSLNVTSYQVILTMVGRECIYNSSLFEAEHGQHAEEWMYEIQQYIGTSDLDSKGKIFSLMIDTFKTLNLL